MNLTYTRGCTGSKIAWALVFIGAINWGLVGFGYFVGASNWNIVNILIGAWPMFENLIYIAVGLSAGFVLYGCRCKNCSHEKQEGDMMSS